MSDTRLVALPERFDFNSHQAFNSQCEALLGDSDGKRIVLDFSRVSYVDSSALGMLVLLHRKALPLGKRLAIRGARGVAKEVLDIANMHRLYDYE
jgi:anti-anti-sigma factor